jgi:transposase
MAKTELTDAQWN